jgi:hypothetical protein
MKTLIESQNKRIRRHLESGRSITALDALYMFGCFRLGARIYDLKQQGLKIKSEIVEVTLPAVFDNKKSFAKYTLVK